MLSLGAHVILFYVPVLADIHTVKRSQKPDHSVVKSIILKEPCCVVRACACVCVSQLIDNKFNSSHPVVLYQYSTLIIHQ